MAAVGNVGTSNLFFFDRSLFEDGLPESTSSASTRTAAAVQTVLSPSSHKTNNDLAWTLTATAPKPVNRRLFQIKQATEVVEEEVYADPLYTSDSDLDPDDYLEGEPKRQAAAQKKIDDEIAEKRFYEETMKAIEAQKKEAEAISKKEAESKVSFGGNEEGLFPKNLPSDPLIQNMYLHLSDLLISQEVLDVKKLVIDGKQQTIVRFGNTANLTCGGSDALRFAIDGKPVGIHLSSGIEYVSLEGSNKVLVFELRSQIYAFIDNSINDHGARVWLLSSDPYKTKSFTVEQLLNLAWIKRRLSDL